MTDYKEKYLKYKTKYLDLKAQLGGEVQITDYDKGKCAKSKYLLEQKNIITQLTESSPTVNNTELQKKYGITVYKFINSLSKSTIKESWVFPKNDTLYWVDEKDIDEVNKNYTSFSPQVYKCIDIKTKINKLISVPQVSSSNSYIVNTDTQGFSEAVNNKSTAMIFGGK